MAWTMNGSKAKRHVLIWRGAAGVLAVSAGALWAVQTPMVSPDVPIPEGGTKGAGVPGPGPAPAAAAAPVDTETLVGVADRLNSAAGRTPVVVTEPQTPEQAPPALGAWKYLGSIIEARRRVAIVSVDGQQAVIPEGGEHKGITLVEVKRDAIVVDDGSGLREMKKEAKTGPSVAWVTPGTAGAGLGGNPAALNAMRNAATAASAAAAQRGAAVSTMGGVTQTDPAMAGLSPQEQAAIRERGIDPNQAQRMRQRLQKERDLGRQNRPGTTMTTEDGRVIPVPSKGSDATQDGDSGKPDAPTG